MENNNQPKTAVWAVALAIATSVFTYWQYEARLVSPRPVFQGTEEASTIGDQKIPARLWQDPLLVFGTNIVDDITNLTDQILHKRNSPGKKVDVMGIMIEGFPYPEDVEERLRIRYSIETALFAQGYRLSDRSHIGLARMQWPVTAHILDPVPKDTDKPEELQSPARVLIPFEWAEKGDKSLLILWLQEEQFADYPLTRLARLIGKLKLTKSVSNEFKFKLIGPRSSDTLKSMLQDPALIATTDDGGQAAKDHLQLSNHLQICSTSATAPDAKILEVTNWSDYTFCRQPVANKFVNNLGENAFTNFILTDDLLASKMVHELYLRQINLADSNATALVLISESDTSYGRTLPACFAAAVAKLVSSKESPGCDGTNQDGELNLLLSEPEARWWPPNVKTLSYLRGLDGTPAKQNAEKEGSDPKKKEEEDQSAKPARVPEDYERAQGEAQLDYVRRLTEKIEKWREDFSKYDSSYRPRLAIGVLGSDTYDKLILLEALRGKFKDAVFFATDLDARYLEKRQQEFCRNLLIVSAEELEPRVTDGTHILTPFREGYQSAVFNACSHVVGSTKSLPSTQARIFEVGLKGPIDLEVLSRGWINVAAPRFLCSIIFFTIGLLWTLLLLPKWAKSVYRQVLPRSKGTSPSSNLLKFEDTYLNAVENEWLCRHFKLNQEENKWTIGWGASGLIITLACWWLFWRDNKSLEGEPFHWANGVSIWPTELMRIVIMFFGVVCLIRAWYIYQRHKLTLWQHFFGPESRMPPVFGLDDFTDKGPLLLAKRIHDAADPLSKFLNEHFDPVDKNDLRTADKMPRGDLKKMLLRNINQIIVDTEIYEVNRVGLDHLTEDTTWLLKLKPQGYQLARLNRLILQDFYRTGFHKWSASAPAMPDERGVIESGCAQIVKYVWSGVCNFRVKIPEASINLWREEHLDFVDAQSSCRKYFRLGRLGPRCFRILLAVAAYSFFGLGLFLFWGFPIVPGRGHHSFVWDRWILNLTILIFITVVFYVVDASRLTERFIHHLGDGATIWPEHVQRKLALDRNLDPAHLAGYLDVKFVAYHTQEVGRLFYFPFLMLTLLLVARNEFFAPWTWPYSLLAINLTSALLVFLSAFHIRRSAQRVRNQAIESLQGFQLRLTGGEDEEYKWTTLMDAQGTKKSCVATNYAEKIKEMIVELQAINTGAYAKVLRDDSVTAAMLPAVGAGLLVVIQKLFL